MSFKNKVKIDDEELTSLEKKILNDGEGKMSLL